MEKKELIKEENISVPVVPYVSPGLSRKIFGIIKFILGLFLLPFVYSATASLFEQISFTNQDMQNSFWSGIISLVVLYLFIWEPAVIYSKGHKLLELIFSFFKPLVRVAPYLLPIYAIILFALYWLCVPIWKDASSYFVFFLGIAMALHLIFSAKTMRAKKEDFLKANYVFGFSFIYLINISLIAFMLSFMLNNFSFVAFCSKAFYSAQDIFIATYRQLFVAQPH